MNKAYLALGDFFDGPIVKYSCEECPLKVMESLTNSNQSVMLLGDPGVFHKESGSWIEALGSWKKPTILIVSPISSSGEIPGSAGAYISMCKHFSVPLLGVVQLGGVWQPLERKLDGLPWCGWIKEEGDRESMQVVSTNQDNEMSIKEVITNLQKRKIMLSL